MKVAVVVPIYKNKNVLNSQEIAFFSQLKKIFSKRKIILILPKSIEKSWSLEGDLTIISFEDYFFLDKISYSKLLCSRFFYDSFYDFDYIQIVQTDCWVFEDRLDYFSSRGFDYIGAPWMKNGIEGNPTPKLWKVGNGGFSLRKISSFHSIIHEIHETGKGVQPVFKDTGKGLIKILKQFGFRNNLRHYIQKPPGEDIFWSIYIPLVFNNMEFRIPDPKFAAHYAFETLPQYLFQEVTHGNLPMGCHNWMNNNPEFWNKYIP